jgi:hypothetical protein
MREHCVGVKNTNYIDIFEILIKEDKVYFNPKESSKWCCDGNYVELDYFNFTSVSEILNFVKNCESLVKVIVDKEEEIKYRDVIDLVCSMTSEEISDIRI